MQHGLLGYTCNCDTVHWRSSVLTSVVLRCWQQLSLLFVARLVGWEGVQVQRRIPLLSTDTLCYENVHFSHFCFCLHVWGGVPSFKELVGSRCDPGESSCWELAGCLPGGGGVHIYECECAPAVGVWVRIEGFWGGWLVVWISIRRRLVHLFFLQAYTYKKRKKNAGQKSLILNVKYGFILSCHSV